MHRSSQSQEITKRSGLVATIHSLGLDVNEIGKFNVPSDEAEGDDSAIEGL